jgi:hypothetical protein
MLVIEVCLGPGPGPGGILLCPALPCPVNTGERFMLTLRPYDHIGIAHVNIWMSVAACASPAPLLPKRAHAIGSQVEEEAAATKRAAELAKAAAKRATAAADASSTAAAARQQQHYEYGAKVAALLSELAAMTAADPSVPCCAVLCCAVLCCAVRPWGVRVCRGEG